MTISVNDIRQLFPNPRRSSSGYMVSDSYCVGGALRRYMEGGVSRFPHYMEIAAALMLANPSLSTLDAKSIAWEIVVLNDAGKFEDAWQWLAKGLEDGEPSDLGRGDQDCPGGVVGSPPPASGRDSRPIHRRPDRRRAAQSRVPVG